MDRFARPKGKADYIPTLSSFLENLFQGVLVLDAPLARRTWMAWLVKLSAGEKYAIVPVGACAFCLGLSGSILRVPGFMDLERALVYLAI